MIRAGISFFLALGFTTLAFGSVDRGLVELLPAGTKALFSVGVEDVRNSDYGQFVLRNMHLDDPHMREFMTQTGFDPRRDLQMMMVATSGSVEPRRQGSIAVLLRGNFDSGKIAALAQQHGAKVQKVDGVDVYLHPDRGHADVPHGFALVDFDVAAIGDLNSLRQIIANRSAPSHLDAELQEMVDRTGNEREVWFASSGIANQLAAAVPQAGGPQRQQAMQALQGIVRSSGGLKLGKTVQFTFNAVTRSDKDAGALSDVIRFMAAAAQMRRDQDPQLQILAPALDNLSLNSTGNEVHVTTEVPESLLERVPLPPMSSHSRSH